MQKNRYQKLIRGIVLFWLFAGVFVLGTFTGTQERVGSLFKTQKISAQTNISEGKDLTSFWRVWEIMQSQYPFNEKEPETKEKIYGAISGLVNSYNDPYTVFFPPKEAKLFSESVKGSFGGVGMEVGVRNNFITVIAPLKNSPAEKSGILAGDIIVEIDKIKTDAMDLDTAISLIRGQKGTAVELVIARKGENEFITTSVIRETISIPTIETKIQDDVFIINLFSFTENSAFLFKQALEQFNTSGKKSLIIDLRNNPGGYLDSALDIASFFLPEGKILVRENVGDNLPEIVHFSTGYGLVENKKIIVLINEGSASASEILAGALSEYGIATTVGQQTFGKGSVQQLINLPDKSSLKITVAKWLTPKGVSISEKGITPMILVEEKPVLDTKTSQWSDPLLTRAILEAKKK
jgi:carboxyl-terminal processing protease